MAEVTPRDFVDQELRLIEKVFNQAQVLRPMFILVKGADRALVPAAFQNTIHKDLISEGVKDLVKISDPDIVIFAAEAWTATVPDLNYRGPSPAERPDRIEIIQLRIEFKTGEKFDCQANILREKGVARLSPFRVESGGLAMGRFVDFFPIKSTN